MKIYGGLNFPFVSPISVPAARLIGRVILLTPIVIVAIIAAFIWWLV